MDENARKKLYAQSPAGEAGDGEAGRAGVLYLGGQEYITGQVLTMDGGCLEMAAISVGSIRLATTRSLSIGCRRAVLREYSGESWAQGAAARAALHAGRVLLDFPAQRFIFDAATHFYPLLGNPTT